MHNAIECTMYDEAGSPTEHRQAMYFSEKQILVIELEGAQQ